MTVWCRSIRLVAVSRGNKSTRNFPLTTLFAPPPNANANVNVNANANLATMTGHALIGKPAPVTGLVLRNQDDQETRLDQLVGHGRPAVVFFYPKDMTLGCTREVCGFRDAHGRFQDSKATLVGISSDSPEKHKQFVDAHGLPFTLLSDPQGEARKAFQVPQWMWIAPGRVTYMIDGGGVVRDVYNSQMNWNGHIKTAIAFVEEQEKQAAGSAHQVVA